MNWLFFALLSAFFASLTAIFGKIGVSGVDSNVATAARSLIMALVIVGLVVTKGQVGQLFQLSSTTTIFVILSAIAGALSWLAYFKALQLGQASQVAPIDRLSLVLAALFLGESFT
ncbi:MAG: hypothetical protein UU73_C0002G0039 [Candidatus Daviesbacteria bacterium GW2011_GWA1_41_61]|uniref:EamA domain-containing protein n=1 Tax=Candidatus Daviesbacteria bacterium GW2011_GWA2_40_9 TaxID=1618424 RepID=A0A0G0WHA4_9BACT|nr:MAG: hypothetical protein UU26_C0015G0027 [Candidatus Daviesbacteria bacterium GW2011_GWC1_40_9]KKR83705.1 MAG: hypothetical protein UU29_C0002G0018 [Candidatus Daviesbacteria bacterium GW2011_GWA2_40_9]KKR93699.1 MAG: hypothetical protein UU44_C0001G0039 [Candidatus Daviesbacteria bacterium GW2011_GWB1_41_15]KKS15165.1 MAG: hypothetical protein UU73_C0002G0039 [Candidatus Daviesbacteria bacterium GW2011_GWA1_41_61]